MSPSSWRAWRCSPSARWSPSTDGLGRSSGPPSTPSTGCPTGCTGPCLCSSTWGCWPCRWSWPSGRRCFGVGGWPLRWCWWCLQARPRAGGQAAGPAGASGDHGPRRGPAGGASGRAELCVRPCDHHLRHRRVAGAGAAAPLGVVAFVLAGLNAVAGCIWGRTTRWTWSAGPRSAWRSPSRWTWWQMSPVTAAAGVSGPPEEGGPGHLSLRSRVLPPQASVVGSRAKASSTHDGPPLGWRTGTRARAQGGVDVMTDQVARAVTGVRRPRAGRLGSGWSMPVVATTHSRRCRPGSAAPR